MQLVMRGRGLSGDDLTHEIGAAVVRTLPQGNIVLELGPADGAPHHQLMLSVVEAQRLAAALRKIAADGGEDVLLIEN